MENKENTLVKVFENPKFGKVRTVMVKGEPWFVGKDVALALGYSNPSNAVVTHVDNEDKTAYSFQVSGSNYKTKTTLINESGVYALVFGSKLPTAKQFKHWVTHDVLPTLRKTGSYDMNGMTLGEQAAMIDNLKAENSSTKNMFLIFKDTPKWCPPLSPHD